MRIQHGICICVLSALTTVGAFAQSVDSRVAAFAKLPDWRGIWFNEANADTGIAGFGDNLANPAPRPLLDPAGPWNEEGRARLGKMFAEARGRKAPGFGYPMMMASAAPLQFLLTPEETLIMNMYQESRHVYTDGRDHPADEDRWVTTWGDSVGHWEGDTLVIDTISVREPPRYFQVSPPFSDTAHYMERLRLVAPDRIEWELTVEDPVTLAQPMKVTGAYVRAENLDRLVHDAFENDRSELDGETFTIAPTAE